ncbi:hypothetical protein PG994_000165 [Apiospora phragmitis]|uniref:Uncharacterized protein n=1 Tax=Apiospora phragmitis TaxID=2905665 RepID=A0ABR1X5E3_9PEZI
MSAGPASPQYSHFTSRQWTLRSCVTYEILRRNFYPEELSRCIAGTWSNIRSPKGFNKGLWNEANKRLQDEYPAWLDTPDKVEKLKSFYEMMRNLRLEDEEGVAEAGADFNAETLSRLEEVDAKKGVAQDAPSSWSPGPADPPSNSHEEGEVAAVSSPHAQAAKAPEKTAEEKPPAEEKAQDPRQQESKHSQWPPCSWSASDETQAGEWVGRKSDTDSSGSSRDTSGRKRTQGPWAQ